MGETEISLYDMNKQVMEQFTPLSEDKLNEEIGNIAAWMSFEADCYFMLLCRERSDYTLIHFTTQAKKIYEAGQQLKEALLNRGQVLSIDYNHALMPGELRSYSIWVRIEDENYLFYLFPYDMGVIEV